MRLPLMVLDLKTEGFYGVLSCSKIVAINLYAILKVRRTSHQFAV